MKKIIISSLLLTSLLNASTSRVKGEVDLSWVDQHITAIALKRVGISNKSIDSVSSPMKITVVKTKKVKKAIDKNGKPVIKAVKTNPLKLKAIMNSKALVGNKWYKVNDKVLGYKVIEITQNQVLLKSKKKKKILFLNSTNKSIKINTK